MYLRGINFPYMVLLPRTCVKIKIRIFWKQNLDCKSLEMQYIYMKSCVCFSIKFVHCLHLKRKGTLVESKNIHYINSQHNDAA